MVKVEILRKVPLASAVGVITPEVGTVVSVTEDIAQALVRGGDAKMCTVEPAAPAQVVQATAPAKGKDYAFREQGGKKNRGTAPENK